MWPIYNGYNYVGKPGVYRLVDGWVCRWMDISMNGWVGGWLDGWMDGRTDGWIDGWIDGWMHVCIRYSIFKSFV